MDQPGPLAGLVDLLAHTLQQTGRTLAEQQHADLGSEVLQLVDAGGPHDRRQGEAGIDPALVRDQERDPPDYAVVVGYDVEKTR